MFLERLSYKFSLEIQQNSMFFITEENQEKKKEQIEFERYTSKFVQFKWDIRKSNTYILHFPFSTNHNHNEPQLLH